MPLRIKEKWPPASGFTGAAGRMVNEEDVKGWLKRGKTVGAGTRQEFEPGNIALRLPPYVLGIDADMYEGKAGRATLEAAEAKWGALPATWMSTSKDDGSGIRLYRIPEGLAWPESLTQHFGGGVELIRWDHRYCVVSPSIHDKTGQMYVWVTPDGDVVWDEFPAPDELAELPEAWVHGLTAGEEWKGRAAADLDDNEVFDWLKQCNGGGMCQTMQATLGKYSRELRVTSDEGGMHDVMRDGAWAILQDAKQGHTGVIKALKKFQKVWVAQSAARRSAHQSESEWKRQVIRGVQKVALEGEPDTEDLCELVASVKDSQGNPVAGAFTKKRPEGSKKIELFNDADDIQTIGHALRYGLLPDTYSRRGRLVRVRRMVDEEGRTQVVSQPLEPNALREELSRHAEFFRRKEKGRGDEKTEVMAPTLPSSSVCDAVLSSLHWDPLPSLRGMVAQPIFRPDGTLIQTPGYDSATGLYYEPEREVPTVDPNPSPLEVEHAKLWLLDAFLKDFPWASQADRANYIALLMTPVLRSYVGGLSPFGVVSATAPGSGKSLLAEVVPARVFRSSAHAWPRREEERQKVITAAFAEDSAVVVFDNVGDTDKLDSPALAKLITSWRWSDRRLGKNDELLSYVNNRLWMATGNNLSLGGDMMSRSVLVKLSPEGDPAKRGGFLLGDLLAWLHVDANVDRLRGVLMLLAIDWIRAGAPRIDYPMRNFTHWAGALGGFLKHHKIKGFMENEAELRDSDVEADDWAAFLGALHKEAAGAALTAAEIYALFTDGFGGAVGDTLLPAKADGSAPTPYSLGAIMRRKKERPIGGFRIVGDRNAANKNAWKVLTEEEFQEIKVREKAESPGQSPKRKKPA